MRLKISDSKTIFKNGVETNNITMIKKTLLYKSIFKIFSFITFLRNINDIKRAK